MRPRTSEEPDPDPETYPGDFEVYLERTVFWARKALCQEQIKRATKDVNRKEPI